MIIDTTQGGSLGISNFTMARDFGNLFLELDGQDPNANGVKPSANYSMSVWKDKSGLGNDVTATSGNEPTYNLNSGNPRVDFSGASKYFSRPFSTALNPSDVSIYILCAANGGANSFRTPICSRFFDGNYRGYTLLASIANTWNLQVGNNTSNPATIIGPAITLGNNVLIRALLRTATNPLVVNGAVVAGTSAGYVPNPSAALFVGAIEGASLFFNGWIKHVLLFNVCHTPAQSNQIVTYLQTRWQGVS